MRIFTIDDQDTVRAFAPGCTDATGQGATCSFTTLEEFAAIAVNMPLARLVQMWNSVPAITPLKKFSDRVTAIARLWNAMQDMPDTQTGVTHAARRHRPAKSMDGKESAGGAPSQTVTETVPSEVAAVPPMEGAGKGVVRRGSKADMILALLTREQGATLAELVAATGWQAHSLRGFLSGTISKKLGFTVASKQNEAHERTYSVRR